MLYRHTMHLHGDYLDGDLTPESLRLVEEHVASCEKCRDDLLRLKKLTTTLRHIESPDPGEQYFDDLLEGVSARTSSEDQGAPIVEPNGLRPIFSRQMLKTLIRLAAAVTLLFMAFYVSDFNEKRQASRWAGNVPPDRYAAGATADSAGYLLQAPVGVGVVGFPFPPEASEYSQPPDAVK